MDLYIHSPIRLHGPVLKQGQLYFFTEIVKLSLCSVNLYLQNVATEPLSGATRGLLEPCDAVHTLPYSRVKLFPCLIKHRALNTRGGVEVRLHTFLTTARGGVEWSASSPGRFTSDTHWIGGWVGPRTGLNAAQKRTNSALDRDRTPIPRSSRL
jgi:hypothetical protein